MADPLTIGMMVASTALTAVGQHQAGVAQQKAANYQAAQADQAAMQSRAASQRGAAEELRKSRIIQGNALAAAGASGGGLNDPDVVKIVGDIAGEGKYRAMSSIFEGENQGNNYENQAAGLRMEGKSARRAGTISALGTMASGASSLYSKYWPSGGSQAAGGIGSSPMKLRTNLSNGSYVQWR